MEADGGGEAADDDSGITAFSAAGGPDRGLELGDIQEIDFALEEADFEALVAVFTGGVEDLGPGPVGASQGGEGQTRVIEGHGRDFPGRFFQSDSRL